MTIPPFPRRQSIRQALWGCLEIPLFFKLGVTRFENSRDFAIWSCLVPALLLVPTATLAYVNPELGEKGFFWCLVFFTTLTLVGSALTFTLIYFLTGLIRDNKSFWSYMAAYNWLNLTNFLMNLPFLLLLAIGAYTWDEMSNLLLFLMLYAYTMNGFMVTYVFRINGFLGASLAVVDLLCSEIARKLILTIMAPDISGE